MLDPPGRRGVSHSLSQREKPGLDLEGEVSHKEGDKAQWPERLGK